jgi:hypothetical protein
MIPADAMAGATSIWANVNSGGNAQLLQWNMSGAALSSITVPTVNGQDRLNGRGIAQIGNTLYYTVAHSNNVYAYDYVAHADVGNGIAFTVSLPGVTGLSSIAFDGSSFYIQDYSSTITNKVFKYSQSGTWQATIMLLGCTTDCDGIEFASGKLVSNRGDHGGPYDTYALGGGAPLTSTPFIADTPSANANTGIAFDGTNYFVSRYPGYPNGQILIYDGNGAYQSTITLAGGYGIEDISVDYNNVPRVGALMICKIAGAGFPLDGTSTFAVRRSIDYGALDVYVHMNSLPVNPFPGRHCVDAGSYSIGTTVVAAEVKPGGYTTTGWVSAISANPASRLVSTDFAQYPGAGIQGIATVTIGAGTTVVYFTNTKPRNPNGSANPGEIDSKEVRPK